MLRVVVDTNVVLSALLFARARGDSPPALIKHAWQSGQIVPVVSRETAQELLTALRYPKFQLTGDEQQHVLAAYLPHCETYLRPARPGRSGAPRCRDPLDQPFVDLAVSASVEYLVTGDKDILAMRAALAGYKVAVSSPNEFAGKLAK